MRFTNNLIELADVAHHFRQLSELGDDHCAVFVFVARHPARSRCSHHSGESRRIAVFRRNREFREPRPIPPHPFGASYAAAI